MPLHPPQRVDLVVVGGGPAGLAAALASRLQGLHVVVLERATPPIDKACGEGLMPEGRALLERLGVAAPEALGRPFAGIRFVDGPRQAEGRFPAGCGVGIRRPRLHGALQAAAEAAGVDLRWRCRVHGLTAEGVATADGEVRSRFVVGADGLASRVRRWAGISELPGKRRRFGVRRHFRIAPWSNCVEVHWGDGCEAFVTPVGAEEVGVALLWEEEKPRYEDLLERVPGLGERLAGRPVLSAGRGAGPFHWRLRRVVRGRVALIGDAAGYVDPITGEGLSLAFAEAFALAAAAAEGDLAGYQRAVRRVRRVPDLLTRLLLAAGERPALRRRLVTALGRRPQLFSRLLAIRARQGPAGARLPLTLLRVGLAMTR